MGLAVGHHDRDDRDNRQVGHVDDEVEDVDDEVV